MLSVLKFLRDFFFEGSYSTIWFLPALMTAAALFFLLRRKIGSKKTFFVGCGIYALTLLLSCYYGVAIRVPGLSYFAGLYYAIFDSVKNGLFFGLVFIAMGGMIQECACFKRYSRKKMLIGVILSYSLLCTEVIAYTAIGRAKGIDTVASLIPLTMCAMLFTLSYDMLPSKLCLRLRKYSMLIFLCQRLPISVIDLFLNKTVFATNTIVNFLIVSVASFGISFAILKLSEKWKWLKKIY